ncbi:MAG: response regulator [Bacteroidales bacterium]|nr:response regulator [Bacteroidales bacterium]
MGRLLRILFIAAILLPSTAFADGIRFQHFSTDDGLPDNSIRTCYQDSYGLMWFCTRDGICMYDGMHFKPLEAPGCDILEGMALSLMEDGQHRLWFVTTRGIGYHDLETGETRALYKNTGGLIGAADIAIGRDGLVWIAAEDILCWDPKKDGFLSLDPAPSFRSGTMTADDNGNLWFLDDSGDLYRFDSRNKSFDLIWKDESGLRFSKQAIASDGRGHILFPSTGGALLQTDILTYETVPLYKTEAEEIRCIAFRQDGTCWLGTENGILIMGKGTSRRVTRDVSDPFSLPGEDVWSMSCDRQGNIWVGHFYNGLSLCRNSSGLVTRYEGKMYGGPLSGNIVRPLLQTDERHLLVGAEDGGLVLMDLMDGKAATVPLTGNGGPEPNLQGLCHSGNDIWAATFGNGVYRLDAATLKVRKNYLPGIFAACVQKTRSGDILLGTTAGLYWFDPSADRFSPTPEFSGTFIHTLFEDSRGNLWIGTYGSGIWTGQGGDWHHITSHDPETGLTSDYITAIREDSRHRVWVCTEAGGVCFTGLDERNEDGTYRFRNLSNHTGLPSSITCCVLEDLDHILWLTTTHGIVKLDPDDLSIREIYLERMGNTLNQYSYGSACSTSSGRLFFGTSRGLVAFSPSSQGNQPLQKILITEIEGNGPDGPYRITGKGQSTIRTDRIRVHYNDLSTLTIRYSVPEYQNARTGLFETTLQGGRKTLRQRTTSGEATYTDLAPGKYIFQVRRLGAGQPRSRALSIEIIPPFYRSVFAYVLYALLGLAILFLVGRQLDHLRQMRMTRELEKMESESQKELYNAKINFFTNITHEIRTPLSLIKMPLDKIISSGNYTESNKQELLTMQANADRLLSLTNQLLDLRKMEKMEVRPVFLSNDLTALVRKVCDRFIPVAKDQHIQLDLNLQEGPQRVDCAAEMVEKILGNLLSNACKYGGGHVRVSLEPRPGTDTVRVRVDSDGDRIPEQDTEQIFEKFYQAGPARQGKGTGLGLPYARSLAALHGGTLVLDRSVRDWNSFVLELPVHQEGRVEMPATRPAEEAEDQPSAIDNLHHTVLVVEDDPEMRGYLAKQLSEEYNVLVAANGEDALELIGKERIDLVVSDIMMPGIDGIALCNRIKSTTEYCHIPVILLTAAVGMETRIGTLEAGADGYIEKPFAIELLQANIANLFKNREIANRQFTQSPLTHFNSMVTGGMDQEFMERLHETVMKHLAEPDLNIETLTSELGTSKSTLYRKVTANTGLNINEYIRVSRLKKAAEMLSSQKYRISEVAYMTGFSSPSYFATCFQKQFNVSPSAFVKNLKG